MVDMKAARSPWAYAIIAGLAANLATLVYAALSLRPLQLDGALWIFNIVLTRRPYRDFDLLRCLSYLLQVPTLLLSWLAGTRDWVQAEVLIQCLSYSLHPFLSLAACAWICVRKKAPWMMLFPVASFAAATQMTLGFVVSDVPESLSLFWPLFLAMQLSKPGRGSFAIALVGSIGLAFGHEWGFWLFLVLLWSNRGIPARAAIFASGCLILLFRGFYNFALTDNFRDSAESPWGVFAWIGIVGSLLYVPAVFLPKLPKRVHRAVRLLLYASIPAALALWAGALTFYPWKIVSAYKYCYSRVPAIPVAAIFALTLDSVRRRFPESGWRDSSRWKLPAALATTLLALAAAQTWAQTRNWTQGLLDFKHELESMREPCGVIAADTYNARFDRLGLKGFAAAEASMLLQGTRYPTRVISDEGWVRDRLHVDFCREVAQGTVPHTYGVYDLGPGRPISLDRVRARMGASALPDKE
jgi:hypothetical protein